VFVSCAVYFSLLLGSAIRPVHPQEDVAPLPVYLVILRGLERLLLADVPTKLDAERARSAKRGPGEIGLTFTKVRSPVGPRSGSTAQRLVSSLKGHPGSKKPVGPLSVGPSNPRFLYKGRNKHRKKATSGQGKPPRFRAHLFISFLYSPSGKPGNPRWTILTTLFGPRRGPENRRQEGSVFSNKGHPPTFLGHSPRGRS